MPRAVAVSPHLDDAVFSAGAVLAELAAAGWRVEVVTAFTRTVPDPAGFALACQTDKGLGPEVDYMALRRGEDTAACAVLGAEAVHLPFAEAPHRGYDSAPALFGSLREDDDVAHALAPILAERVAGADLVLTCQGVGDHVDHRQLLRALGDRPLVRWLDLPYAIREASPPPHVHPLAERKLDAVAAYASQVPFQFGGEDAMRARLRRCPERFDAPLPVAGWTPA